MLSQLRLLLVLVALTTGALARELKPRSKDDDATDRYGHVKVKPALTYAATGAVTVAATALQLMKPSWVENTFGAACEHGAGALLLRTVRCIDELKTTNPLGLTMGHGMLLKAVAEVLSQVIPQGGPVVWLDPLRLVRSTVASLLSSSLTFYYWTRSSLLRGLTAPGWLRALLGKGLGTSVTKMVVTQLVYRPVNVLLFLAAQAFFRGDSARAIVHVLRTKFAGGLVGGVVFFAISNMIMFSIPIPFLHPIIGALAGLVFNVWLAMVAYQKAPDKPTAAKSAAESAAPGPSLGGDGGLVPLSEHPSGSLSEFPATTALLGSVALLEAMAGAALYSTARLAVANKLDADRNFVAPTPRTADTIAM